MVHTTFKIPTPHPPELVIAKVQSLTQPESTWQERLRRLSFLARLDKGKPFHGRTGPDWFHIQRDAGLAPAYLAIVRGKVEKSAQGSTVSVEIHLSPVGHLCLGGILVLVAAGLINYLIQSPALPSSVLVNLGLLLLFGVVILVGGFLPEVFQVKRLLKAALGESA